MPELSTTSGSDPDLRYFLTRSKSPSTAADQTPRSKSNSSRLCWTDGVAPACEQQCSSVIVCVWGGSRTNTHRILRQSLGCCVCGRVLRRPIGPPDSPCGHHVCLQCVGGKMRFKPACSWCKDASQFAENSVLRTVVQCYKKLCQYVAASGAAAFVAGGSISDANQPLMAAIQDGILVDDDYQSPAGPQLGAFPPKLHKVQQDGTSPKQELNAQHPAELSNADKGEGQLAGSVSCTERSSSRKRKPIADESGENRALIHQENADEAAGVVASKDNKSPSHNAEARLGRKRRKTATDTGSNVNKPVRTKLLHQQQHQQQTQQPPTAATNGIHFDSENILSPSNIYETVAAEHDYNRDSAPAIGANSILKVRIRKVEGDHESLIRRSKLVAEPMFNHRLHDGGSGGVNSALDGGGDDLVSLGDISNSNETIASSEHAANKPPSQNGSKKKISGCRCGLATPNPGKLTCCGQRCPCYSSFKGCVDCKCRGCRNPRGDKPSPHSLKAQLQQQKMTPPSHIPLTSPSPQLILTPIKMDSNNIEM